MKTNLATWTILYYQKALIIFHHDAPNILVQALTFLSSWQMPFQQQAIVNLQSIANCNSHTASAEIPPYFLWSNTCFSNWLQLNRNIITIWKCILLKLIKVLVKQLCCCHLLSAQCLLVSKQRFNRHFPVSKQRFNRHFPVSYQRV